MENLQQPSPQSWMVIVLVSLAILFSSCFSQSSGSELLFLRTQQQHSATSVIQEACSHSLYKDFCISSLASDPRSINADLKELTVIAIDIAKTNGTAILAYITNELIGNSTTIGFNIKNCQQQYQNAVRDLGQAIITFNGGDYRSTNMFTGAAGDDADLCMSPPVVVQEVPTLLIQMSKIMFKLCDNALQVLCKYSSECSVRS